MPTATMLDYEFMRTAFAAGGIVAVVAGAAGFFLVLRNLTFAGHALSHVGFAGATGSVLIGVAPLWGLLAFTLAAAVAMGLLGDRLRGRDVAVGVVLFLAIVAVAVAEAAQVVGVLLVFALMVGPAAAALAITSRIGTGIALAVVLALIETWAGIALAYVSDWPATFWIVLLSCAVYFASASIRRVTPAAAAD